MSAVIEAVGAQPQSQYQQQLLLAVYSRIRSELVVLASQRVICLRWVLPQAVANDSSVPGVPGVADLHARPGTTGTFLWRDV